MLQCVVFPIVDNFYFQMIRDAFVKEKAIDTKDSVADLVTVTDQAVEKMVFSFIREKFPQHKSVNESCVSFNACSTTCIWLVLWKGIPQALHEG